MIGTRFPPPNRGRLGYFFGYDRSPVIGYEQQIGLYHINIGEHHVHQCGKELSDFGFLNMNPKWNKKYSLKLFGAWLWRKGLLMLSINQFMPFSRHRETGDNLHT
jgi:hypothetical protein